VNERYEEEEEENNESRSPLHRSQVFRLFLFFFQLFVGEGLTLSLVVIFLFRLFIRDHHHHHSEINKPTTKLTKIERGGSRVIVNRRSERTCLQLEGRTDFIGTGLVLLQ
jgi:hypothetical protein